MILLCICLFHAVCNYIWVKKDYFSFSPEKFYELHEENKLFFALKEPVYGAGGQIEKIRKIFKEIVDNPRKTRLIPAYTAVINYYLGEGIDNSLLSNIPFLILGIIFVFLLGKKLFSIEAGLLAAYMLSFYPAFYGSSRAYGADFPLIALVAMLAYFLVKTWQSADIKNTLFFTILFSISILISPRVIIFLFGPIVYVYYICIKEKRFFTLLNIFGAIVLTIIITSVWWFPIIKEITEDVSSLRFFAKATCGSSLPIGFNIINYFKGLVGMMSLLFTLVLFPSLFNFVGRKSYYKFLVAIFLISPFCVIPFFIAGSQRYFFPALVGFALITASWLSNIRNLILKRTIVALLITLSLSQFFGFSFGFKLLPDIFYRDINTSWARPPSVNKEAVAAERFFNVILNNRKRQILSTRVSLIGKPPLIDSGIFEYIFFSKTGKFILQKFFLRGDFYYRDCDFAIIVTDKPKGRIDTRIPDIEFIKFFDFNKFLRVSYGGIKFPDNERKKMYNFLKGFHILDCFNGDEKVYYLCINPQAGTG